MSGVPTEAVEDAEGSGSNYCSGWLEDSSPMYNPVSMDGGHFRFRYIGTCAQLQGLSARLI